jgi:hypothetical protein
LLDANNRAADMAILKSSGDNLGQGVGGSSIHISGEGLKARNLATTFMARGV